MREKLEGGILVLAWLLFCVNWLGLLIIVLARKNKEDN